MEKQNIVESLLKIVEELSDGVKKLEEERAKEFDIVKMLYYSDKLQESLTHQWDSVNPIIRKIDQIKTAIDSIKNAIHWVEEIGEKQ